MSFLICDDGSASLRLRIAILAIVVLSLLYSGAFLWALSRIRKGPWAS